MNLIQSLFRWGRGIKNGIQTLIKSYLQTSKKTCKFVEKSENTVISQ